MEEDREGYEEVGGMMGSRGLAVRDIPVIVIEVGDPVSSLSASIGSADVPQNYIK